MDQSDEYLLYEDLMAAAELVGRSNFVEAKRIMDYAYEIINEILSAQAGEQA